MVGSVGSTLPILDVGLLLGTAGCWSVQKLVASLLFGVSPIDLGSVAAALGLLAVTVAVAIAVPADRAARAEPVYVLGGE